MDDAEHVSRRAEMCGSESLAVSSPSTSMNLGSAAGPQGRAGGYTDPDDVDLSLEPQDGALDVENDILTYVQIKVSAIQHIWTKHNTPMRLSYICTSGCSSWYSH